MPQIQLLDGKKIPFTKSITGLDLTKKISKSLEKNSTHYGGGWTIKRFKL